MRRGTILGLFFLIALLSMNLSFAGLRIYTDIPSRIDDYRPAEIHVTVYNDGPSDITFDEIKVDWNVKKTVKTVYDSYAGNQLIGYEDVSSYTKIDRNKQKIILDKKYTLQPGEYLEWSFYTKLRKKVYLKEGEIEVNILHSSDAHRKFIYSVYRYSPVASVNLDGHQANGIDGDFEPGENYTLVFQAKEVANRWLDHAYLIVNFPKGFEPIAKNGICVDSFCYCGPFSIKKDTYKCEINVKMPPSEGFYLINASVVVFPFVPYVPYAPSPEHSEIYYVNYIKAELPFIVTERPSLDIEKIYPEGDLNVSKNQMFPLIFKLSCEKGKCGTLKVSLDPTEVSQVKNNRRDAWDDEIHGSVDMNYFGDVYWNDAGGYQFRLNIPKDAIIDHAYLSLYSRGRWGRLGEYKAGIFVEDKVNPRKFNGGRRDVHDRKYWDHYVVWEIPYRGWEGWANSTDIAPLIQHIISNPKWEEGSYLGLAVWGLTDNHGSAEVIVDYSDDKRLAPRLYVTWHHGGSEKGVIPMKEGKPFYTISENPREVKLNQGDVVYLVYFVNATGEENTKWEFFLTAENDRLKAESNHFYVTIKGFEHGIIPLSVENVSANPQYLNETNYTILSSYVKSKCPLDYVKANVTYPDGSYSLYSMTLNGNIESVEQHSNYVSVSGKDYTFNFTSFNFLTMSYDNVNSVTQVGNCVNISFDTLGVYACVNEEEGSYKIKAMRWYGSGISIFKSCISSDYSFGCRYGPASIGPQEIIHYYPKIYFGGYYDYNFTDTSQSGRYNVTIIAHNLCGETNDTESTYFIVPALDTIPPVVWWTEITPNYTEEVQQINLTSSVTDNTAVDYVEFIVSDGISNHTYPANYLGGTYYQILFVPPIEGNYTIYVHAADVFGNEVTAFGGLLIVKPPVTPPPTLTCGNITSLGLVSQPAVLSPQKLIAFVNLNYYCKKQILGLWDYDFHFKVQYQNGTVISINGTEIETGLNPPEEKEVSVYSRSALIKMNNTYNVVDVILEVWRSEQ